MKSTSLNFRNVGLAAFLAVGLCLGNTARSAPLIQSVEVSPSPFVAGRSFTVAVTASADVTQAVATVDFRPASPQALQIPLTRQGLVWTGSSVAPTNLLLLLPGKAGAMVRVQVSDAANLRSVSTVQVGLRTETISAVFAGGVLTVTGDDLDNTIVVQRDVAGRLLVNGGAVPITGGVATVANTTLIRIVGLAGDDNFSVNEANGPVPPTNLLGGEGDDTLIGGSSADELDGGPGNDTLRAGGGDDRLLGGSGNDILIGGTGVDQFFGGDGDDQIVWNPGDGSDVVEGEDGQDTMVFVGGNGSETVDISAVGQRLRFFRNPANITMDCDGVEEVVFRAAAGNDAVTVNDLTGTLVRHVSIDLFGSQTNTVVINGTGTNDIITVTGSTNNVDAVGLTATVSVSGGEQGVDELVINSLAGADVVDASAVKAGTIDLTLNGGIGDDVLIGGEGNDLLVGGPGTDTEFGGDGDDTSLWNPGDGNDLVEGEQGQDTLLFNGANIVEHMDILANGQRLRLLRNVGNITMDCGGVELVQLNAKGGADIIQVGDLTGTDVARVNLDLASPSESGTADGEADTVSIKGTPGDDHVIVTGSTAGITVTGLSATVGVVSSDADLYKLMFGLQAGADVFEASGLQAGVTSLTVDGGAGNDILIGSAGPDVLLGGEDDDVLQGGPGLDALDGGPGDNVVIQD